ncbi:MAG: hypothetical protein ACXWUG_28630 [Polyangiales bacterium]
MRALLLAAFATTAACSKADAPDPSVRTLKLPDLPFELPGDANTPGRALTQGTCTMCHSARYIANQPKFPRKTWTAEVEKMKKVYGAPIADDKIKEIVDYLVTTNGRED